MPKRFLCVYPPPLISTQRWCREFFAFRHHGGPDWKPLKPVEHHSKIVQNGFKREPTIGTLFTSLSNGRRHKNSRLNCRGKFLPKKKSFSMSFFMRFWGCSFSCQFRKVQNRDSATQFPAQSICYRNIYIHKYFIKHVCIIYF